MKKMMLLGMGVCVALTFSSCKSSESAYKKAYEKAKQQELAETTTEETPVAEEVTPVVTEQVVAPVVSQPVDNVREEKVTVVSGDALKDYCVVCGSFGVKANADNLKSFLDGEGYNSVVAYNAQLNMYRVIVSSYDDHATAAQARDAFKAKYPNREDFQGSWLLYSTK